jgi:hypothetical protein
MFFVRNRIWVIIGGIYFVLGKVFKIHLGCSVLRALVKGSGSLVPLGRLLLGRAGNGVPGPHRGGGRRYLGARWKGPVSGEPASPGSLHDPTGEHLRGA